MTTTSAATAKPAPAQQTTPTIRFLPPTLVTGGREAGAATARKVKNVSLWESRHMESVLKTFTEHRYGHTVITHLLPRQGMMVYAIDPNGKIVGTKH